MRVARIAKSLSTCSATTGEIVTATERLKLELENATQRQELIANFLHNYQLSPEEVCSVVAESRFRNKVHLAFLCVSSTFLLQVFALREEDLSENFFKALTRVQEIHANCKVLLRTHHQVWAITRPYFKMLDGLNTYVVH